MVIPVINQPQVAILDTEAIIKRLPVPHRVIVVLEGESPFAAFVLAFRYANFYRRETRWKIALETWVTVPAYWVEPVAEAAP